MQHCGNFTGLHRHQIASNAIDDRLKNGETIEMIYGLVQYQTTKSVVERKLNVKLKTIKLKYCTLTH